MASPLENGGFGIGSSSSSCLPSVDLQSCTLGNKPTASLPLRSSSLNPNPNEMKQTEEILADELSKISIQERSKAYDDLHCVGDEPEETPEMIQKSLLEFDIAIPKHRTAVYDIALKQNKKHVEDPYFRLKFLRAQMHNVEKAVDQMMRFLHYKKEYFGEDKLGREITLDDLTEEEKRIMLSGLFHIQAGRDRMGRVIVYWFHHLVGRFDPASTFRAWYYVAYNILVSNEDVQKKGMVEIYLATPKPKDEDRIQDNDGFRKMLDASNAMPYRFAASHKCLPTPDDRSLSLENAMITLYIRGVSLYSRVRTRIHYGTYLELKYKLGTHGIPSDTFPVDTDGNIRQDIINAWFFEHQAQEGIAVVSSESLAENNEARLSECAKAPPRQSSGTRVASAITPTENDVLSGRGRYFQDYPGNVRFRNFMEEHSDEYDKLDRHDRMILTIRLMHELSTNNVRFLKQTNNGEWVTLDVGEVRKKVSQQFRSIRKKHRNIY